MAERYGSNNEKDAQIVCSAFGWNDGADAAVGLRRRRLPARVCSCRVQRRAGHAECRAFALHLSARRLGPATYTPDGYYAEYLRENANVDIEVQIIPIVEYDAKVKTIVASGSLPDMLMASGPVDPYWKDLENQGAFTPLEEYLEKYPALKELADDSIWEMLRNEDGHIYFLPRTLVAETPFMIYYRQDYFEELGIEEPTTVAELEAALEKIKAEMPDVTPMAVGNGGTAWMGKDLATAFGATIGGWVPAEDGSIVPDYLDPKNARLCFLAPGYEGQRFAGCGRRGQPGFQRRSAEI